MALHLGMSDRACGRGPCAEGPVQLPGVLHSFTFALFYLSNVQQRLTVGKLD